MKKIEKLVDILARAADSYYNTEFGLVLTEEERDYIHGFIRKRPETVTDPIFDKLVEWLKEADPKNPFLKKIGAPSKKKVLLPIPMSSLDKIKPGEVRAWRKKYPGPYIITPKLDGVSLEIKYTDKSPNLFTRGDGEYGQNISYLAPHLNIPKTLKGNPIHRAEMIMKKTVFAEKWADKFENARNLVSGVTAKKGIHEAINDIDVVVYEVMEPRGSDSLKDLYNVVGKTYPNYVVGSIVVPDINDEKLASLLLDWKQILQYEIDGLVIEQYGVIEDYVVGENPKSKVAFKMIDQCAKAITAVEFVEWNISKTGAIKPRIKIRPVSLDGVTINWVTGFHAKYICEGKIGKGAIIEIIRSGGVIPHINHIIEPARKPDFPPYGIVDYKWDDTNTNIYTTTTYDDQMIKRIAEFFKKVDGFGIGIAKKLYEGGFEDINSILNADWEDFYGVDGIGEKVAEKLEENITKYIENADIAEVADGSGIFGPGMGSHKIQWVIDTYDLHDLSQYSVDEVYGKVMAIKGFSEKTAYQFSSKLHEFIDWLDDVPITYKKKVKNVTSNMAGMSICFTGFRDRELEAFIEANGGKVSSSVSKNTSICVAKDKKSGSIKVSKAIELGITVLTPDEFRSKYE